MLTWFWFVFGLICLFAGIFIMASDVYVSIKDIKFDNNILGQGLAFAGGALAFLMLFAKGIAWITSLGG
jgi:hypothetical protein